MDHPSRRDFMKVAAAGAALATASELLSSNPALGAETPGTATSSTNQLQMCIARGKGSPQTEGDIKKMAIALTEKVIDTLGGMGRFVKKGDVVWVKPNMAWDRKPELAANTNPDVVATLVRLCLNAGAKEVKVGDKTCNEARKAYPASGIEAAVKEAGGTIVYLEDARFKEMEVGGKRLTKWKVYPEIAEANLVINVPIVKHHAISTATLCMKNYMGVVGGSRGQWHQALPECLCDITAFMKPRLCVLDAIRILTANGPTGGDPKDVKRMDTLAAGTDIVALDAFGAELLGHKPEAIKSVAAGHAAGLGTMDYRKLALKEIEVA